MSNNHHRNNKLSWRLMFRYKKRKTKGYNSTRQNKTNEKSPSFLENAFYLRPCVYRDYSKRKRKTQIVGFVRVTTSEFLARL